MGSLWVWLLAGAGAVYYLAARAKDQGNVETSMYPLSSDLAANLQAQFDKWKASMPYLINTKKSYNAESGYATFYGEDGRKPNPKFFMQQHDFPFHPEVTTSGAPGKYLGSADYYLRR